MRKMMKTLEMCIESVMLTGKINSELIESEFSGPNRGMDLFQAAMAAEGLAIRYYGEWVVTAADAVSAFKAGLVYRPRVWGIGINATHPREDGVELITRAKVLDGIEVEDQGSELVLFHYRTSPTGRVHKQAVARTPAPKWEQASKFSTQYNWVESDKKRA
jgi:hypothetical protein